MRPATCLFLGIAALVAAGSSPVAVTHVTRPDRALEAFRQAVALDPSRASAHAEEKP